MIQLASISMLASALLVFSVPISMPFKIHVFLGFWVSMGFAVMPGLAMPEFLNLTTSTAPLPVYLPLLLMIKACVKFGLLAFYLLVVSNIMAWDHETIQQISGYNRLFVSTISKPEQRSFVATNLICMKPVMKVKQKKASPGPTSV